MPRAIIRPRPRQTQPPVLTRAARERLLESIGINWRDDRTTAAALIRDVIAARADYAEYEAWAHAPTQAGIIAEATQLGVLVGDIERRVARKTMHPKTETHLMADGADLEALRRALATVRRAVTRLLAKPRSNSRGRPTKNARRETIKQLVRIYDRYAGADAGVADRAEFVAAALDGMRRER